MYQKIIIALFTLLTFSFAIPKSEALQVSVGTDPLPLLAGIPFGMVSVMDDEGISELSVSVFSFADEDENISAIGTYPAIRYYNNGEGKGPFVEGGIGLGFINWDYSETEEVTAITYWPTVNMGYKWNLGAGLSLSPYIGANIGLGTVEAADGTIKTFIDDDGETSELTGVVNPSFGGQVNYTF